MSDKLALARQVFTEAKTAMNIMEIPEVGKNWIKRYEATTGEKDGELKFELEKLLFLKVFEENPKLDNCDPMSKYTAFMDLCVSGLTLKDGLSYVFSMDNKKVMFMPGWKGRLEQIKKLSDVRFVYEPEVVYDCDTFVMTKGMKKTIKEHTEGNVTENSKIVRVYVIIDFFSVGPVVYDMLAKDVVNIRDKRSRSYQSYVTNLAKEKNKGRKLGDKVIIQYKDRNQQWAEMETEPPMWVTDEAQAFKKTLIRHVWNNIPKTDSEKKKFEEEIKKEPADDVEDLVIHPDENNADDADHQFTSYEEVNGDTVDNQTGEIIDDEETF